MQKCSTQTNIQTTMNMQMVVINYRRKEEKEERVPKGTTTIGFHFEWLEGVEKVHTAEKAFECGSKE